MEKLGFLLWLLCAALLFVFGIFIRNRKTPASFFANVKQTPEVRDIKAYNRAVSRLWMGYAILFALLGLPLLQPASPWIMLSVIGIMLETILLIFFYLRVYQKYKK